MTPSTALHARAVDAIRKLTIGGVAPSYGELGAALGISSRGALHALLQRMRKRGLIDFKDGQARSIRVIGDMEGLATRSSADLVALRRRIDALLAERAAQ